MKNKVIGQTFGEIKIYGRNKEKGYDCKCLMCGKNFTANHQTIMKCQEWGCQECSKAPLKKIATAKKLAILKSEYIGTVINGCEIKDLYNVPSTKKEKSKTWCTALCPCGTIFNTRFSAVKSGSIKTCGHDRDKNLKEGHDLIKKASVNGTNIIAINRKSLNRNNTSGYTGVSLLPSGKARAYISFQRRQYSLGVYSTPEEAHQAYLRAKKEIHGGFIEWYKKEFPDSNVLSL